MAGTIQRTRRRAVVTLIAPFAVLFVAVYILPICYALYQSLFTIRRSGAYGVAVDVFGGLTNYTTAVRDTAFMGSLGRMLEFGVVQVPVMLVLALVIALLLDAANLPGRSFFRTSVFMPYAVPTVMGAIMWGFLYTPGLSPVTDTLHLNVLGPHAILWGIANVVTWTWTGYNALIIYSSLQTIDPGLYEAARVDGARGWQIAVRIKVPLVLSAVVMTALFSIVGTVQLFTEPTVLQPVSSAITSTYTPNMAAYTQAAANNYHYSAALAVILAVVTAVLSFGLLRATQRRSG